MSLHLMCVFVDIQRSHHPDISLYIHLKQTKNIMNALENTLH